MNLKTLFAALALSLMATVAIAADDKKADDAKPAEAKADAKPADAKPAEAKADAKPADAKPAEGEKK